MDELISNLGIDWKLIIAQIVNFSILVFVLTKFVYKPILSILKKRIETVEKSEKLKKDLEDKLKDTENAKDLILDNARSQSIDIIEETKKTAEQLKQQLLNTAKLEVEKIQKNAQKEILADKDKTLIEAKREIGSLVSVVISKIIGNTIDSEAQNKLLKEALDNIPNGK